MEIKLEAAIGVGGSNGGRMSWSTCKKLYVEKVTIKIYLEGLETHCRCVSSHCLSSLSRLSLMLVEVVVAIHPCCCYLYKMISHGTVIKVMKKHT